MAAKVKSKAKVKQAAATTARWTDEQVKLLMDSVEASRTAKDGFERAAKQLGKNVGTVQQKYYNVQKAAKGGARGARAVRRTASAAASVAAPRAARAASTLPSASDLRTISIDELVALAQRVKGEVERRRQELGAAAQLFK